MINLIKKFCFGLLKILKSILLSVAVISVAVISIIAVPRVIENAILIYNGVDVMYINVMRPNGSSMHGTGFHVTNSKGDQYLLTAEHVCRNRENGSTIWAYDAFGNEYPTYIVKPATNRDLCALKSVGNFNSFDLQEILPNFSALYHIGYPSDYPLTILPGEIVGVLQGTSTVKSSRDECRGYFSSIITDNNNDLSTCIYEHKMLQTTISVRPGSSGGPILNIFGEVIGMVIQMDSGSWARAILAEDIKEFIEGVK